MFESIIPLILGFKFSSSVARGSSFSFFGVFRHRQSNFSISPLGTTVLKGFGDNFTFYHAEATSIDVERKVVICKSMHDVATSDLDGAPRVRPAFEVEFDALVIACGAQAATYGVPGVERYTFPLKQLSDARLIRQRLVQVFERASSPFTSDEEKRRLLHIVVVGGGPTSIEFAAELHDFLRSDAARLYPDLTGLCRVSLVEAGPRVLGSFSQNLAEYTMSLFRNRKVDLLMGRSVKVVHPHAMDLSDGTRIPFGLAVWCAGNEPIPFIRDLPFEHDRLGRLVVDDHLRVAPNIYAIGDCAAERTTARPQTAQVANQEGKYVARILNGKTTAPFKYNHMGMLAYVGGSKALVDLPQVRTSGFVGWLLWNSAYLTDMVSWRNKLMNPMQWLKVKLFGRDFLAFGDQSSFFHHKKQ